MRGRVEPYWQAAVRLGLIAGVVGVLLALIGMVGAFSGRYLIGGVLTFGHVLLAITPLLAGYLAARRAVPAEVTPQLVAGTVAGLVAGAVLGLLVVLGTTPALAGFFDIFDKANPALFNFMAFDFEPVVGGVALAGLGAILGLGAAALTLLSSRTQRTILWTATTVVVAGLLASEVRVTLQQWRGLSRDMAWAFSGKGLSPAGALVVGGLFLAGRLALAYTPARAILKPAGRRDRRASVVAALVVVAVLAVVPPVLGQRWSEVFNQVGLYVLMGLGLNIVVGFAGLLDLGYVAFFALGAYTVGIFTSPEVNLGGLSWWPAFLPWTPGGLTWLEALPLAILVAIAAGVLLGIPVLKMRGDYLAIVTLGFGEIIRILALSDWLRQRLDIGGAQGIARIPAPAIGPLVFQDQRWLYLLILAGCILVAFVAWRLRDSRLGRAWMAMREDEDVAEAVGINLVATKLLAFATGAAFSGISGAIFAAKLGSIYPHSFELLVSIRVLALIIIGGMGSIPGVVVGSLVLVGLPEVLREFEDYRLLVYGAVLVLMMLYRPEGLWPEASHRRELHVDENVAAEEAVSRQVSEAPLEAQPTPEAR